MVGVVSTGGNVRHPQESTKGILFRVSENPTIKNIGQTHIIKTVSGKEICKEKLISCQDVRVFGVCPTLVELISGTSPKISNLLGLDVTGSERRALQRRSWDLQDRQRRGVCSQSLSNTGDGRNEGRQRKALPESHQRRKRSNGVLHFQKE